MPSSPASSPETAVSVRGLSKSYTIAHEAQQHTLATEALVHSLKNLGRKAPQRETFWALTDVSFDIAKGDVVGIIGRNGAGKSTLLKVLSRITEPTTGQIELYGRVGSLLEVGTGFHPELTGRENIFLNGAVLGMSRREIAKHFEAIVEFAGVEKFLDTPVKRYSSGMYVRLAFAVAAHLEPEILIVDEVLAVGDAEFQKKCLGKMQDVASRGRTVLFVSHNMTSVLQLCTQAIFLHQGQVCMQGPVAAVVDRYIEYGLDNLAEVVWAEGDAPGDERVKITAVRILNSKNQVSGDYYLSDPITLEMEFSWDGPPTRLNPSFHVNNVYGNCVFATINLNDPASSHQRYETGRYRAQCVIPAHLLNDGQYRVSAFVMRDINHIPAMAQECVAFHANDDGASRVDFTGTWIGIVRPELAWQVERLEGAFV